MFTAIQFSHVTLSCPRHTLVDDFCAQVPAGARIGIIGPNGAGKSTLLKAIAGQVPLDSGSISLSGSAVGLVEQHAQKISPLSGAEQFHATLTKVLAHSPDVLLLDEPTNHLDEKNTARLMGAIERYWGTVIIASHDPHLLNHQVDTLWVIENQQMHQYHGSFESYWREREAIVEHLEAQQNKLKQEKKHQHQKRMNAQEKAAKSSAKGKKSIQQRKWPTIVSDAKLSRATMTAGKKTAQLNQQSAVIEEKINALRVEALPIPTFHLGEPKGASNTVLSVQDGGVGLAEGISLLESISVNLSFGERVGLYASNASGKSSFFKAIMGDKNIIRSGNWSAPLEEKIGWLDQHYHLIEQYQSPLEAVSQIRPDWTMVQARRLLCDFLFKSTEAVEQSVSSLSGGEKARAALACIAAHSPKLLLLDEITNNIDWWTRRHLEHILKTYPGSMLVISHDKTFLEALEVSQILTIRDGRLVPL